MMGGGPQAPTYDSPATLQQGADQITSTISGIRQITPVLGNVQRSEAGKNLGFHLNTMTQPGAVIYAGDFNKATKGATAAQKQLDGLGKWKTRVNPKTGATQYYNPSAQKWVSEDRYNQLKTSATTKLGEFNTQIAEIKDRPINELKAAFPEQFAARDGLLSSMKGAIAPTSEYARAQDAFGRGITAQTADATRLGTVADITAAQAARVADIQGAQAARVADIQGARAARVGDISAQMVGSGQLGGSLMNEAMRRMELQGRLSAQDSRDVTQATRQGMAARGMAMGNAAIGAELLNRDRYTRQRAFQDMGFAQGIQEQDLQRQQLNFNRALEASRANQSVAAQMSLADLDAEMRARMSNQQTATNLSLAELDAEMRARQSNQQTATNLSLANQDAEMRARTANQNTASNMSIAQGNLTQNNNQFNAQQIDSNNRYNMGLLGTSAQMADAERLRQLGLQQDSYNFGLQTDPRMMIAGLGTPLSNMTSLGAQLAQTNLQPVYSGAQFSSGGGAGAAMGAGGALLGAGAGALLAAPTGGMSIPMGMALGGSLGGAGGNFAGSFFR
jgi:hypothetical protein